MPVSEIRDDQREQIRQGLMLLAGPAWQADHVVELRAIDTPKGIVSGWFDREHLDEMVEAAWTWSGAEEEVKGELRKTLGVYLTFNGAKRDCLARAANRVKTYAKHTTAAEDIERRYWLLIDCDPYTAVKNVSATDQEKERTRAAADTIRDCLTAKGWPMPALGDTGNGHALYYRIDLPADDGGLVSRVLNAIKAAHPGIGAKIDLTVCNADRLCKIPGSVAAKGDHTAERPHRISALVDVPETLQIVTQEQLESLAGASSSSPLPAAYDAAVEAHATAVDRPQRVEVIASQLDPDKPGFDVGAWLVEKGLRRADGKTKPWNKPGKPDGKLYVIRCPWRDHKSDAKTCVIRYDDGRITAGCQSDNCEGKGWAELRDAVEPGWRERAEEKRRKKPEEKPAVLTLEKACEQAGGSPATNGDWNFDGEATEALKLLGIKFETPPQLANRPQKLRQKNGRLYVLIRGNAGEKTWNMPGWSYDSTYWERCIKDWQEPKPADDADKPTKIGLFAFAMRGDEYFHTAAGDAYVQTGNQTWPIESTAYKRLLRSRVYAQRGTTLSSDTLKEIVETLAANAVHKGPEREVCLRTGGHGGKIYLDLCNESWQAVEIDGTGCRVVDAPPVRFERRPGMLSLPIPVAGGSIQELREFVNVSDEDWPLLVMWLISALRPDGPYPVLMVEGDEGSAKTFFCRLVRSLADPNKATLASLPSDRRDLAIAARNSYIMGYDNLSHIPADMSDALCSLATGGGFRTRSLHTNDEEMIFAASRPQMLNGISGYAAKSDLLSRAFAVKALPIRKYGSEKRILKQFTEATPRILGALLKGASAGICRLAEIEAKSLNLPRMVDALEFAIAAETGLGFQEGEFERAAWANRDRATDMALASSPIAEAVLTLMGRHREWSGTATELLSVLTELGVRPLKGASGKDMTAPQLSKALSEAAPNLGRKGVAVEIQTKTPKRITLTSNAKVRDPLLDTMKELMAPLRAAGCGSAAAFEIATAAYMAMHQHTATEAGITVAFGTSATPEHLAEIREAAPRVMAQLRGS